MSVAVSLALYRFHYRRYAIFLLELKVDYLDNFYSPNNKKAPEGAFI